MLKVSEKKQHVRNSTGLKKHARIIAKVKNAKPPAPVISIVNEGGITILDLKKNQCKWPVAENEWKEITFCGKAKHEKGPYCIEHHKAGLRKFNQDY